MPASHRDPECIFCKIAAGEVPATKVYEDEVCLVFMDIGPISPGHTLLVPVEHYEHLTDLPTDQAAHIGRLLPKLTAAVAEAVEADGINLLQNNGASAGQVVGHIHFHLIPRWPQDGLGFRWPAKEADPEVLERQAEVIRTRLNG